MDEYDLDYEHYTNNEDENGTIILNLQAAYPGRSMHEIAQIAIASGNVVLVRAMAAYPTYLPIRWDVFIDDAPTSIILIFYDHLSPYERKRAAYKMRIPSMINRFPPDQELARQYSYAPFLDQSNPVEVVRYLDPDRISLLCNKSNVYEIIDLIFAYGRVDALEEVTRNRNVELNDLLPSYVHHLYPRRSMMYLFNHNIYEDNEIDNIDGIPINVIRAVTFDDPSLLNSSFIPTDKIMSLIYDFDALQMFKRLAQIPLNTLQNIHGNIMRYIITTYPPSSLRQLIPDMMASDMMLTLSLHSSNNPLRLSILEEAANAGYIEVLDKYMRDMDLFPVLASLTNPSPAVIKFIDYKFKDAGTKMMTLFNSRSSTSDISISRVGRGSNTSTSFVDRLMDAAIASENIPLISVLKPYLSNLTAWQQVALEYHADQPQMLALIDNILH